MELSKFVLSDEAVNIIDNGTWVGDLPGAGDAEFFVCGFESDEAVKARTNYEADARLKNQGAPLTAEQHRDVFNKVLAEVCLKDWRGWTVNGEPVPYDKEKAVKWITSRNGREFANLVFMAAKRVDTQANELSEALLKN